MRVHLLPPPARHPFGPTAALGWAVALLGAPGLAVPAFLLARQGISLDRAGMALLLWLACVALAGRWWRSLPRGELVWNGRCWSLTCSRSPGHEVLLRGRPEVRLDVQSAMLLLARPQQGRAQWLWLTCPDSGRPAAGWAPMRRALHSRAPEVPAPDSNAARPCDHAPG